MFLALLFFSFLPCIIKTVQRFLLDHMSTIANQKFNQLYLQGYQPLQRVVPPGCHRSLRILPHTMPPASRKQLRGQCFDPIPDPQPLPSSLLKKKWGNDRIIIMSPFCESATILSSGLTF
jgi:hypothetical protein